MFMYNLLSTIFPIFFVIVLAIILFGVFKGIKQWSYNNKQPVLTVDAKIVGKRSDTSRTMHNYDGHHRASWLLCVEERI